MMTEESSELDQAYDFNLLKKSTSVFISIKRANQKGNIYIYIYMLYIVVSFIEMFQITRKINRKT